MTLKWVACLVACLLVETINTAAQTTLFDDKDKVIIYNKDNYKRELYSGEKAHLVLLYSSWCGHCQRFAPTYKEFAQSIHAWSGVVEVTGVDCVYDTDVCRQFNVKGYPTLRFIGPTTNTSETGITYTGERSISDLRNWTIQQLADVAVPPAFWPVLQEVTEEQAKQFVSGPAGKKPHIVIVVLDKYTGREVLLNLHDTSIRYTLSGSKAAEALQAKSPGLVLLSATGKLSHVSRDAKVQDLEEAIKEILQLRDEKGKTQDDNQNINNVKFVDTEKQYRLYEVDLQSAVNNAFYTEVSLKSDFTPTELENLKNFVNVVHRCGSWTLDYKKQISRVRSALKDLTTLNNSEWSGILKSAGDAGFPMNSSFVGCRGSQATTRGYSCSLWLLFHTMLANCYNSKPAPGEVLRSIHGYIDSYFTCAHCRTHFLAMAERMRLTEISDERTAVLAFWEAHNQVNERLSVVVHDAYFPKVQYPPRSLCKECSNEHQQYNTDLVFDFLMKHYRKVHTPFGKMRYVTPVYVDNVPPPAGPYDFRHRKQAKVELQSGTNVHVDLMFYFVVCLMCAGLLIALFIVLFKRKLRTLSSGDVEGRGGTKYTRLSPTR